jgi:hypothetical protein
MGDRNLALLTELESLVWLGGYKHCAATRLTKAGAATRLGEGNSRNETLKRP